MLRLDWDPESQRAAEEIQLKEHESGKSVELNADEASSAESVKVDLIGREYNITGYGNSKEVQKLTAFINQRAESIKKKASASSSLDLLVLTLLNITDEMLQHKHAQEVTIKKLEEKTDRLLRAIDRIV